MGQGSTAYSLDRFRNRALLLAALLALACGLTFDPKLYVNGDNVEYMLLAQRVLREGDLWGSGKFPPVFPLLLAPVQLIAGTAWVPQKILVALLFVATGPLMLLLAERAMPRRFAFPAVALGMLSIPVIEFSHYVMSEVPYLFFQTAAFVVGGRLLNGEAPGSGPLARRGPTAGREAQAVRGARAAREMSPKRESDAGRSMSGPFVLFFVLAALAFYTRTIGAIVPAAFLLVCLLRRRFHLLLAGAGATAVLLVPWLLHTLLGRGEGATYVGQLVQINPYYPEDGLLTAGALLERLGYNASRYFGIEIPRLLVPLTADITYMPRPEAHRFWPAYLWILPLAVLFLGFLGRRRALPLTLAGVSLTLLVCLLWPPIWTSVRFIIPILPLLVLFFVAGCRDLLERTAAMAAAPRPSGARARPAETQTERHAGGLAGVRRRHPAMFRAPDLALGLILLLLLGVGVRNLQSYERDTREYPLDWKFYFEAARWAGEHLPHDALVIDRKPSMFAFVSGVRSAGFPREADPDRMIAYLRNAGADYVHISSIPYDDVARFLYPVIQQRPTYFLPFWRTERVEGMMSALFAFDPGGRGPGLPPPEATPTLPPLKSRPSPVQRGPETGRRPSDAGSARPGGERSE